MAAIPKNDLKFGELRELADFDSLIPTIRQGSIARVAEAFAKNIGRVNWLAPFVPFMTAWAMEWQALFLRAVFAVRGDLGNVEESEADAVYKELQALQDAYYATIDRESEAARLENRTPNYVGNYLGHGMSFVCSLINRPEIRDGMESILLTMIVGAWTAFESLAEDLWETCLNNRPRLGFIAIGAEPASGDDDSELERKRRVKFQIPAWRLKDPSFDVNRQMGSLLKAKWDFARRDAAEDAYSKVFPENSTLIRDIFNDERLRWLVALRNAIVHDAGNATAEFLKLVQRHPTLSNVPDGARIPIDTPMVVDLVNASTEQAKKLISLVDSWMTHNPT